MRCYNLPLAAVLIPMLVPSGLADLRANPASLRERSFRPIVPIAQSVRSGSGSMHSQLVRVSIPSAPLPTTDPIPSAVLTPVPASLPAAAASLPEPGAANAMPEPESLRETSAAPDLDSKSGAEAPEAPGRSKTPGADLEKKDGPALSQLREEAHALAGKKLSYVFGADDPDSGGLDCSSTIQYLLTKIGVKDVPRTSYDQYYWLKRKKLLDDVYASKSASSKLLKKLSPGDLIFWGGTWKSGHRVSHVMLYMGYDPSADKHYVFGARSKSVTGLTGAGVDIFELDTERGRLVAHGKIPGLVYE